MGTANQRTSLTELACGDDDGALCLAVAAAVARVVSVPGGGREVREAEALERELRERRVGQGERRLHLLAGRLRADDEDLRRVRQFQRCHRSAVSFLCRWRLPVLESVDGGARFL